ncbi:MAG: hypothetical protein JWQ83_810 [Lacunisphaera sp.]|nr:hypothetical protein [Lacunisphaera sp.]MDB6165670.1 hypothetical protein [Lacunisphaera sp.]
MEAVVILLVPLIAAAVYLGARFQGQGIALDPQQELAQLQERLAWHEDRLRQARAKNWDEAMVEQIASQLAEARRELGRFSPDPQSHGR